jgi:hypothetical protein
MDKGPGGGGGGLLALGFHSTMDAAVPHKQHQHGRRTSVEVDFFSGDKNKEAEPDRTTIKEEDPCLQLLPAGNNDDEGDDDTKNTTTEVRRSPPFFLFIYRGINGCANILIQSRMIDAAGVDERGAGAHEPGEPAPAGDDHPGHHQLRGAPDASRRAKTTASAAPGRRRRAEAAPRRCRRRRCGRAAVQLVVVHRQ